MGLTVCRKTTEKINRLGWQILIVSRKKMLTLDFFPFYNVSFWVNRSRKMVEILIVSRKSHHPIENLFIVNYRKLNKLLLSLQLIRP